MGKTNGDITLMYYGLNRNEREKQLAIANLVYRAMDVGMKIGTSYFSESFETFKKMCNHFEKMYGKDFVIGIKNGVHKYLSEKKEMVKNFVEQNGLEGILK